jgi:peptide/nickel transport system substrate-binding protein
MPTAQPAAMPNKGASAIFSRNLTFVAVDEPAHIDWTDGNPGGTTEFFRDSFNDTLTWKPSAASSQIAPRLAESWQQVAPDEWVWKLRKDVTYHNGEKWNAQAAAHNLNLAYIQSRNHGLPTYLGYFGVKWSADGESTLRQKCPQACVIAPLAHTFSEVWQAPKLYDSLTPEQRRRQFSGNGPYKLVAWTPGVSLKAEAYDGYWQGKPKNIPEVTIVWRLEELVRGAMVQTGEADFAVSVGTDNLQSVPKAVVSGTSEVFMLMLNQRGKTPALQDERVRRALLHAVDCQEMSQAFFAGRATCQGTIFTQSAVGNRADIARPVDFNLQLARELLLEADYANRFNATTDLAIFTRRGRVPHDVEALESVTASWKAIGVKAHVEVVETSIWNDKFRNFHNPGLGGDVVVTPHGNEIGDGARSLRYLNCNSNSSSVCDPRVQELVDLALAADAATREEKIYQAFKYSRDHAMLMPLFELAVAYGVVQDLDFTPRSDRRIRFNDQFTWLK